MELWPWHKTTVWFFYDYVTSEGKTSPRVAIDVTGSRMRHRRWIFVAAPKRDTEVKYGVVGSNRSSGHSPIRPFRRGHISKGVAIGELME